MKNEKFDTFLNYTDTSLTDYLQMKINTHSKAHQAYSKEYNRIGIIYPKVIEALENEDELENYDMEVEPFEKSSKGSKDKERIDRNE